jgi:hypothetical protein
MKKYLKIVLSIAFAFFIIGNNIGLETKVHAYTECLSGKVGKLLGQSCKGDSLMSATTETNTIEVKIKDNGDIICFAWCDCTANLVPTTTCEGAGFIKPKGAEYCEMLKDSGKFKSVIEEKIPDNKNLSDDERKEYCLKRFGDSDPNSTNCDQACKSGVEGYSEKGAEVNCCEPITPPGIDPSPINPPTVDPLSPLPLPESPPPADPLNPLPAPRTPPTVDPLSPLPLPESPPPVEPLNPLPAARTPPTVDPLNPRVLPFTPPVINPLKPY